MIKSLADHGLPLVQLKEQRRDLVVALQKRNGPINGWELMQVAAVQPAHLQIDGRAVGLRKRLALSGTHYSGGGITLRIAKAGASIKRGKRPVTACSTQ